MKIKCPVCESNAKEIRLFAQRGEEKLKLVSCSKCGQEFLNPYPSDQWLSEEYLNYYIKRSSGLVRPKKDYFKNLFSSLGLNFNGSDVLEFGPGEGDALSGLKELFHPKSLTTVERNQEAVSYLKDLGCEHYNMFLEEYIDQDPDNKKFDFILLFDVLEHLKDPVQVMKELKHKKLKSGGIIITTFPVADSYSRKTLNKLWPQYKVEHLNYFTKKSIHELALRSNLHVFSSKALIKKLTLDYLFNVGKGFGPDQFKKMTSSAEKMLPKPLKALNLSFGYGERLVLFKD
jgi:SAM-dependent methyltransferase